MNILLIDDDQPVFRTLRNNIETHYRGKGIRLYYEATIPGGLQAAKDDPTIKLALLDLGMPCVDGPKDALNYIKKFPCSVAVYSANADPDMVAAATDAGAVSFISKFDRWEDQVACIDEIVQSIRAAHVRMKTEAAEGYSMTQTVSRWKVPVIIALAGLLLSLVMFFTGEIKGALATAADGGRKEQLLADRFEKTGERMGRMEAEFDIIRRDRDEASKWRSRMEKNILLLMRANKIDPPRDGE